MKRKRRDEYPPLELLRRMTAEHPGIWDDMEMLHKENGTGGLPHWPEWCYAPIAAAMASVMGPDEATLDRKREAVRDAQAVAALAPWRQSKEVYVLDPDMQGLLFEQEDLDLSVETLLRLPYPGFYIEFAADNSYISKTFHGVFIHLEYDVDNGDRELRLLYLPRAGIPFGIPVHLDAGTIADSVRETYRQAHKAVEEDPELRRALLTDEACMDQQADIYRQTVQVVLYLCAQNAEISQNSEQAFYTKRTPTIKDRYAEIRKWDVGMRIGKAIRAYRGESVAKSKPEGGHHASPRPHMRRGHWHSFWSGPKADPDQRKLELMWVAPTIVGANQEVEPPVTLHKVLPPDEQ